MILITFAQNIFGVIQINIDFWKFRLNQCKLTGQMTISTNIIYEKFMKNSQGLEYQYVWYLYKASLSYLVSFLFDKEIYQLYWSFKII